MKMVEFTPAKLGRLKAALKQAQDSGKGRHDVFELDGDEYVVGYAVYLITFLETKLGSPERMQ